MLGSPRVLDADQRQAVIEAAVSKRYGTTRPIGPGADSTGADPTGADPTHSDPSHSDPTPSESLDPDRAGTQ
jgi:hypothetical protein